MSRELFKETLHSHPQQPFFSVACVVLKLATNCNLKATLPYHHPATCKSITTAQTGHFHSKDATGVLCSYTTGVGKVRRQGLKVQQPSLPEANEKMSHARAKTNVVNEQEVAPAQSVNWVVSGRGNEQPVINTTAVMTSALLVLNNGWGANPNLKSRCQRWQSIQTFGHLRPLIFNIAHWTDHMCFTDSHCLLPNLPRIDLLGVPLTALTS